ncbi:MAG: polyphenol oxidase family protein [Gemmatimonadales bacterium]
MTSATAVREDAPAAEVPRYDVPSWHSRFGVVAGITGRRDRGGTEFDLSLLSDRPAAEVMGRWRTLRDALSPVTGVVQGHQVHGVEVRWHDHVEGWLRLDGVDGHATGATGLLLTVTVADCIPVYLVDPKRRACALLHAGWRGAASGILTRGVELLADRARSDPADVVMHCGIGMCGTCFEVGSEVLEAFGLRGDFPRPWAVDVRDRLAEEGRRLGIGEISVSQWCTVHDHERFFSHRASGGAPGRMVAYLGLLDAP